MWQSLSWCSRQWDRIRFKYLAFLTLLLCGKTYAQAKIEFHVVWGARKFVRTFESIQKKKIQITCKIYGHWYHNENLHFLFILVGCIIRGYYQTIHVSDAYLIPSPLPIYTCWVHDSSILSHIYLIPSNFICILCSYFVLEEDSNCLLCYTIEVLSMPNLSTASIICKQEDESFTSGHPWNWHRHALSRSN